MKKILVVDDDRDLLNELICKIEENEYFGEYKSAVCGKEALEIAKTFKPDIVLTDEISQ